MLKYLTQYRCEDGKYYKVLNHLRYYKPTQSLLAELHRGRVVVPSPIMTSSLLCVNYLLTLSQPFRERPANLVAVQHLFTTVLLAQIQYDCDLPPISIYRGMQVIKTQNRYKDHGVVNGARAKFD